MAAVEGLSLLIAFLAQPYLMRTLGPSGYGNYALACGVGLLAGTITDFGFVYAGVREALMLRDDANASRRLFWRIQIAKLCVGLLCVLVSFALALAGDSSLLLISAVILGVASTWLFPTWHLLAVGQAVLVSVSLLVGRILSLIGLLWLVKGPTDLFAAVGWTLAAPLIAAPLTLLDASLRRNLRWVAIGPAEVLSALRLGGRAAWIGVLPAATSTLVQTLIATLGSASMLGIFAAADKLRSAVQGLFLAFGMAIFPSSVLAARNRDPHSPLAAARALWPHAAMACAAALPLALFAGPLVDWILGPRFESAAPVLATLSLALVSGILVQTCGVQWLLPIGNSLLFACAAAVGLVVCTLALLSWVPEAGAIGAAWALVIGDLAALTTILLIMFGRQGRPGGMP
jgi:PST family polysaccharide transporter